MNNIDLTYLNEISGGDKTFIREMLDLFANTTADEVELFDKHLAEGNYEAIGQLAHKMKAPIQMLGASELFEQVRSLELNGKQKTNLDTIPGMINDIKVKIGNMKGEIENILQTLQVG